MSIHKSFERNNKIKCIIKIERKIIIRFFLVLEVNETNT